ncbi:MAG: AAA family ATPase, partial [Candidatus Omnitrophica bacterium]|nr:AAA family ATPase [Candidatus Omnitrophota bacterium]
RESLLDEKDKIEEKNEKLLSEIDKIEDKKHNIELNNQKFEVQMANHKAVLDTLKNKFEEYKGIKIEIEITKKPEAIEQEIRKIEDKIIELGNVNMLALEEYKKIEQQYLKIESQVKVLESEKNDVLKMIEEIESRKKHTFIESFNGVSKSFESLFSQLSPDGWGKLVLENAEDPFSGGIEIEAKPRGKKVMTLNLLSGGEKTITALAFIFAIQESKMSPFYVMDEIDSALDKENSKRLAVLIEKYSSESQFIVISHNDTLIGSADRLIGVSMDAKSGESKIVGIKMPN